MLLLLFTFALYWVNLCVLQCVTGIRCAVNAMIAAILYLLPIQESETELAGFWFSFFQEEYLYHCEKGKSVDYAYLYDMRVSCLQISRLSMTSVCFLHC